MLCTDLLNGFYRLFRLFTPSILLFVAIFAIKSVCVCVWGEALMRNALPFKSCPSLALFSLHGTCLLEHRRAVFFVMRHPL